MLQLLSNLLIPLLILNIIHRPSKYKIKFLWLPEVIQVALRQVVFLMLIFHPYGMLMYTVFIAAKFLYWIFLNDFNYHSIHDFIMIYL